MRKFFTLGFAPENRIGRAVELRAHEIPGCTPEAIRQAGTSGIAFDGFSTLSLAEGRPLHSLPTGVKLTIARRRSDALDFDVVVNGIGWIIVSNRLGDAFKTVAPNDVELLPVVISGTDGELLRRDFCVANALQMVEAMSEQKSVRSRVKWPSGTYPVIHLAVVGSKIPSDVHVFRIKECPHLFIVDEEVKKALSQRPHDGLAFIPVEQE
jgi:hypothetical protein